MPCHQLIAEERRSRRLGIIGDSEAGGDVKNWFQAYQNGHLDDVYVHEEHVPASSMVTLLVLLTIDERDIYQDEEEE